MVGHSSIRFALCFSVLFATSCGEQQAPVATNPIESIANDDVESGAPLSRQDADQADVQTAEPAIVPPEPDVDWSQLFPDIPPPPAPFSGEEVDPSTPVPLEAQKRFNASGDELISAAEDLMQHPNPSLRKMVAARLTFYNRNDYDMDRVVQVLRQGLLDPDPTVRDQTLKTVTHHGAWAKNALPELAALVENDDPKVSKAALEAIGKIGPAAAPLVPYLLSLWDQPNGPANGNLMQAWAGIGPAAKSAAPLLADQLSSEDNGAEAGKTLGAIGAQNELLAALARPRSLKGRTAIEGVVLLDSHSPAMVQALISLLDSNDEDAGDAYQSASAANALGNVRPTTLAIVEALGRACSDPNEIVKRAAIKALGNTDPPLAQALPFLEAAAKDENNSIRREATEALENFEVSPQSRLTAILDQCRNVSQIHNFTTEAQAIRKSADEFFPLLTEHATDPNADEMLRAIALLMLHQAALVNDPSQEDRKEKVVQLATSLQNNRQPANVQGAAAVVLTYLKAYPKYQQQLNAGMLRGAVQGDCLPVRIACVNALHDQQDPAAIEKLVELLKVPDPTFRSAIAGAVGAYGDQAEDAIPVLVQLVQDRDEPGRADMVAAIGDIAAAPELSVPVLGKLIDDPAELVGQYAMTALAKVIVKNDLDGKPFTERIVAKMKAESNSYSHGPYLRALQALGPKAAPAVDALIPLLDDSVSREKVIEVLSAIGPQAETAAPKLIELVVSGKDYRIKAIQALGNIRAEGDAFAAVVPQLLKDLNMRYFTFQTLLAYGPDAAAAAPEVAEQLATDDYIQAAQVLGAMGPAAKQYAPKLLELLGKEKESELWRRGEFAKALWNVDPDFARQNNVPMPKNQE